MVGKEALSASTGSEDKLVSIGDDTPFHGQVTDVHMNGNTVLPVSHADAEWAGRTAVVRFSGEQADGLFQKGIERFFRRKIACIARNTRPIQHRSIDRVMTRRTLHHGKLAACIVLHPS